VRRTISSRISRNRGSISTPNSAGGAGAGGEPTLREELERASSGLVYSSESDRPFEFFSLRYPGKRGSPDGTEFARLVGAFPEARVQVRSIDEFFARHTTTSDPYDSESQHIRPRYEELVRVLSRHLRDVKVYRIGRIEIACYVMGLDGDGNLAGLKTVAIET